ncbi:MAG TPA: AAA family ATPase [Candidatus Kapabacteria bacterium]|nr:AAA family ATPase [Candidatus Kapabacteria bacterium]
MKVIKIEVKKLFGVFDHEIPLNAAEHITIIHGPNGYGKTILLTMVNAVFNSQYSRLFKIPFSELMIDFDDNSTLSVKKNIGASFANGTNSKNEGSLTLELSKPQSKPQNATIKQFNPDDIPFPLHLLEREIKNLERIEASTWLYLPTGEKLLLDEVLDRFSDRLPLQFINRDRKIEDEYGWFKKIKESIDIHFIETQRLLRFSSLRRREFEESNSMVPAVVNYSNELAVAIQKN